MPLKQIDPSWQGFGDNLAETVRRFADFTAKHVNEINDNIPKDARQRLENARSGEKDALHYLKVARENLAEKRQRLARLHAELVEMTDEEACELAERLLAMPFVVGVRVDRNGFPAFVIRVKGESGGEQYDIGDFDVALALKENESLYWVRVPEHDGGPANYHALHGFTTYTELYGGVGGRLCTSWYGNESPIDILSHSFETLSRSASESSYRYGEASFPRFDENADLPSYSMLPMEEFVKALQRWHGYGLQFEARQRVASCEQDVVVQERTVKAELDYVREAKKRVRTCDAELKAALAAAKDTVTLQPDVQRARRDIKKISSLPGVMGMRFTDDGVPIVHVRASIVYHGRRYDMGDHEIYFRRVGHDSGTLNIHATRGKTMYTHNERWIKESWFCVGARSGVVRKHFDDADFPGLVHVLINTMNRVNNGSEDHIPRYFSQIPMNHVWEGRVTLPRMRPRRKPRAGRRNGVEQAMGVRAIRSTELLGA